MIYLMIVVLLASQVRVEAGPSRVLLRGGSVGARPPPQQDEVQAAHAAAQEDSSWSAE